MKKILLVLGTAREGRKSEKVFNYVLNVLKTREDIEIETADVREYPQSKTEGLAEELRADWKNKVDNADGLIFVSPEYNHGYPGELKMLIDNAYKEYNGKPVGICGVSDGPLGGARMAEQLKLVLSAAQVIPINAAVYFASVNDIFEDNGSLQNADYYEKRVRGMVDEIIKYSR